MVGGLKDAGDALDRSLHDGLRISKGEGDWGSNVCDNIDA